MSIEQHKTAYQQALNQLKKNREELARIKNKDLPAAQGALSSAKAGISSYNSALTQTTSLSEMRAHQNGLEKSKSEVEMLTQFTENLEAKVKSLISQESGLVRELSQRYTQLFLAISEDIENTLIIPPELLGAIEKLVAVRYHASRMQEAPFLSDTLKKKMGRLDKDRLSEISENLFSEFDIEKPGVSLWC